MGMDRGLREQGSEMAIGIWVHEDRMRIESDVAAIGYFGNDRTNRGEWTEGTNEWIEPFTPGTTDDDGIAVLCEVGTFQDGDAPEYG